MFTTFDLVAGIIILCILLTGIIGLKIARQRVKNNPEYEEELFKRKEAYQREQEELYEAQNYMGSQVDDEYDSSYDVE